MANNTNLGAAKAAKNDEFYTQYADIQKEINAYLDYNPDTFRDKTVLLPCDDPEWSNFTKFFAQNFERLGLKRLISTSYAVESKKYKYYEPSLFETESPKFDADKTRVKGKIFELTYDTNQNGRIDIDDLEWHYMEGDGDFRSKEVCKLRDEADVIVTNPPFSLFREFLEWCLSANKTVLILGNMNAVTYKEVFPLIKNNKIWYGSSISSGDREFMVPKTYPISAAGWRVDDNGDLYIRVKGVRWFTNIEHGRRHEHMKLMSMKDNLRYSKHKDLVETGYRKYDNYDAIEVPYSDAIPDDYTGQMGVPISFLDKYCPEQFEIVGMAKRGAGDPALKSKVYTKADYPNYSDLNATPVIIINGVPKNTYPRILIRKKQ